MDSQQEKLIELSRKRVEEAQERVDKLRQEIDLRENHVHSDSEMKFGPKVFGSVLALCAVLSIIAPPLGIPLAIVGSVTAAWMIKRGYDLNGERVCTNNMRDVTLDMRYSELYREKADHQNLMTEIAPDREEEGSAEEANDGEDEHASDGLLQEDVKPKQHSRWDCYDEDFVILLNENESSAKAAFNSQWNTHTKVELQHQALSGSAKAQFELGCLYKDAAEFLDTDYALDQDNWYDDKFSNYQQADEWLATAATHGVADAAYEIVFMYERIASLVIDGRDYFLVPYYKGMVRNQKQRNSSGESSADIEEEIARWLKNYYRPSIPVQSSELQEVEQLSESFREKKAMWLDKYIVLTHEAAKSGDLGILHKLAKLYAVAKSSREAFQLMCTVAEKGHIPAQIELGEQYCDGGNLVGRDDEQAFHWFTLAASQGSAVGQFLLGDLYDRGQGVACNIDEAFRLYRLAEVQGYRPAQLRLKRLFGT